MPNAVGRKVTQVSEQLRNLRTISLKSSIVEIMYVDVTYPKSAKKEPDKLSLSGASKNSLSESLSLCIFLQ